jgi:rRNA-processing protein FCF1
MLTCRVLMCVPGCCLQLLEQLKAEANEAERKRLLRKARSERIPTAPNKKQDPVLFQALTREWDEKRSLEELRGARAAARQVWMRS